MSCLSCNYALTPDDRVCPQCLNDTTPFGQTTSGTQQALTMTIGESIASILGIILLIYTLVIVLS